MFPLRPHNSQAASANPSKFIQYILLTPTYINVLNIYAFCNTHDITWGTKGDDAAQKLPSANLKPGGKVDVNIPQDDGDLNAQYDAEMLKIAQKAPKEVKVVSEEEKQEDYYKGFRSSVVLVWIFCNFALGAVVLSAAGLERIDTNDDAEDQKTTIYMAVVLWSVAGLALFRFIGAMWFLIVRMVSRLSLFEPLSCFKITFTNLSYSVPRRLNFHLCTKELITSNIFLLFSPLEKAYSLFSFPFCTCSPIRSSLCFLIASLLTYNIPFPHTKSFCCWSKHHLNSLLLF